MSSSSSSSILLQDGNFKQKITDEINHHLKLYSKFKNSLENNSISNCEDILCFSFSETQRHVLLLKSILEEKLKQKESSKQDVISEIQTESSSFPTDENVMIKIREQHYRQNTKAFHEYVDSNSNLDPEMFIAFINGKKVEENTSYVDLLRKVTSHPLALIRQIKDRHENLGSITAQCTDLASSPIIINDSNNNTVNSNNNATENSSSNTTKLVLHMQLPPPQKSISKESLEWASSFLGVSHE